MRVTVASMTKGRKEVEGRERDKREVGMFVPCEVTSKKMKIKSWRREERVEGGERQVRLVRGTDTSG